MRNKFEYVADKCQCVYSACACVVYGACLVLVLVYSACVCASAVLVLVYSASAVLVYSACSCACVQCLSPTRLSNLIASPLFQMEPGPQTRKPRIFVFKL